MPEYDYMLVDRPISDGLTDKEIAEKRAGGWELCRPPAGPIGESKPVNTTMARFFFRHEKKPVISTKARMSPEEQSKVMNEAAEQFAQIVVASIDEKYQKHKKDAD